MYRCCQILTIQKTTWHNDAMLLLSALCLFSHCTAISIDVTCNMTMKLIRTFILTLLKGKQDKDFHLKFLTLMFFHYKELKYKRRLKSNHWIKVCEMSKLKNNPKCNELLTYKKL